METDEKFDQKIVWKINRMSYYILYLYLIGAAITWVINRIILIKLDISIMSSLVLFTIMQVVLFILLLITIGLSMPSAYSMKNNTFYYKQLMSIKNLDIANIKSVKIIHKVRRIIINTDKNQHLYFILDKNDLNDFEDSLKKNGIFIGDDD